MISQIQMTMTIKAKTKIKKTIKHPVVPSPLNITMITLKTMRILLWMMYLVKAAVCKQIATRDLCLIVKSL